MAELHRSGLMRLMQPARFGGAELGLDDLMNVVFELARGCASTAWVYSNLASHAWNLGQFELQAQEDIWGEDPNALAATGLAFPCGKATPVEGGYQLSGLWPFGSGVDASTWMLVGAMPPKPDAKCDSSAIERNLALSQKIRVNGTPAILFEDGSRAPGAICQPMVNTAANTTVIATVIDAISSKVSDRSLERRMLSHIQA